MKAKKLLEYKLKGERNISSRKPLIIGNKLFVIFIFDKKGFSASNVTCLDKNNFDILWVYSYPFVINNILKSNSDNVFVCCMDGKLLELNQTNGELINSFDLDMDRCGQSSDIVDNKLVFGGVQGTKITACFEINPFQRIWTFENGGHSYIPLISDDKVYQCTEKNIRCLDIKSGKIIWEAFEESTYIFNPTSYKDMVAVGGHGLVNIYNSQNGKQMNQIKTEVRESIRAIIYENNIIYFGDSSGNFYAYKIYQKKNILGKHKTISEPLWKYDTNGAIESTPVFYSDKIMFINDDNKLTCLDKTSGKLNWDFNTKGEAGISGISVEDEFIFTSIGKGYVYKLIEE